MDRMADNYFANVIKAGLFEPEIQNVTVVAYDDGVFRESVIDNPEHSMIGLLVMFCWYTNKAKTDHCTRTFLHLTDPTDPTDPGSWYVATTVYDLKYVKPCSYRADRVATNAISGLGPYLTLKLNEYMARRNGIDAGF